MASLPRSLQQLAEAINSLPGIGPKSAYRLVFFILNKDKSYTQNLASMIAEIQDKIQLCENCYNYSEETLCTICQDSQRSLGQILVVENPLEIMAYEDSGYKGFYHCLGGLLSPLQGIGPEKIRVRELLERLTKFAATEDLEVIIGCSTSLEGQATAEYLRQIISAHPKLSRLVITLPARGLPTNSAIEYLDGNTLRFSLENRK